MQPKFPILTDVPNICNDSHHSSHEPGVIVARHDALQSSACIGEPLYNCCIDSAYNRDKKSLHVPLSCIQYMLKLDCYFDHRKALPMVVKTKYYLVTQILILYHPYSPHFAEGQRSPIRNHSVGLQYPNSQIVEFPRGIMDKRLK